MTMATEEKKEGLAASSELIRSAARWLVGALGAIGAVLIAGSQLSSIGSLPGSSYRLWLAVAGLAIGLGAVLYAIWRVVELLLPERAMLAELAEDWERSGVQPGARLTGRQRRKYPWIDSLARNPESFGGTYKSVPELKAAYDKAEPADEDLPELVTIIDEITELAQYEKQKDRFNRLRWHIAAAMVVSAVGITVFAWAANPSDDAPPVAVLRGADLAGSDLRDAMLVNADLRDSDLRDADLTGSDLEGARTSGVTWGNTICPDGTNSDDVGGTCEGHLTKD
jgi:hypothetical protein